MDKPIFFPKDEYCVSYSELIQRELLWLEFFFSFLFSKIVKLFLRQPNPNLILAPTILRVIVGEEQLFGSDLRDLSFTRRKLTI